MPNETDHHTIRMRQLATLRRAYRQFLRGEESDEETLNVVVCLEDSAHLTDIPSWLPADFSELDGLTDTIISIVDDEKASWEQDRALRRASEIEQWSATPAAMAERLLRLIDEKSEMEHGLKTLGRRLERLERQLSILQRSAKRRWDGA